MIETKKNNLTRVLRNGYEDKLIPLHSLDLSKCNTVNDIITAMRYSSFVSREAAVAADVLYEMAVDKECLRVLTISGAMTIAKMGLIICEMIENKMIDMIVCTGALMSHGLIENAGMMHFKNPRNITDEELYKKGYDRVHDTIELESNFNNAAELVYKVLERIDSNKPLSSFAITRELGKYLYACNKGRGILISANLHNVPVYIPAFTDSEMGLDFALFNRLRLRNNKKPLQFDSFLDLEDYTEKVFSAKKIGIFTIGGGVPRNWAQQVGPYLELIKMRLGGDKVYSTSKSKDDPYFKRFSYAVRICPDPVYLGGLSGCSYSEGVSWGKFVPESEGGKFSEVHSEATIALPFIVKAVLERIQEKENKVIKDV